MNWEGIDPALIHRHTLAALRACHLASWDADQTLDLGNHTLEEVRTLVSQVPKDQVLHAITTWNQANPRNSQNSSTTLEIAAAQICRFHHPPDHINASDQPIQAPAPVTPQTTATPANIVPPAPPAVLPPNLGPQWQTVTNLLTRQKGPRFNLGALLRDCRPNNIAINGQPPTLTIRFTTDSHYQRMLEELQSSDVQEKITQAIRQAFRADMAFKIEPPQ